MSPQVQSADSLRIECDMDTSKMGVLVSLGGIIMLFVTFLATFSAMVAKELATINLNGDTIIVAGVTTLLLILSSLMFHSSYNRWNVRNGTTNFNYLYASAFFGIVFLFGQIKLWLMFVGIGFTSNGNVLAGMVYLIGAVHAVHLIVGLSILCWLGYQLKNNRQVKSVRYQMIGWFWHFLTVLWCIIFVFFIIIL